MKNTLETGPNQNNHQTVLMAILTKNNPCFVFSWWGGLWYNKGMALNLGSLYFRMGADTRGLEKATRKVKNQTKQMERDVKRTTRTVKGLDTAFRLMGTALTITAGVAIIKTADNYNLLQKRIRLATKETGDYMRVSDELNRIAKATGTELGLSLIHI